ncbi:calcineurin-binding protein 1 isoform X2 [Malania oleifera]|uniref:calcineurin-binding protein 1 isoform X2 n=1 Tax=Malania oleifera TaxID=397392 RepID=UPI0025AE89F0|nr:calcineurin-binding protein 1 isoform X2 [Malania oleifera]
MFSISAINDTDSKGHWEPLAPTKEAQESHLSQIYHEGLLKLETKEYENARELLEAVLKDPLLSSAQVENNASDGHLLQLRFLALKNLATVFLQQDPIHYEKALRCYLQAVEIDTKDSVVWNQLGTLSCSMGSLSISRWAFEQGLFCSPNNWNCMEKLLEVLIAIGDEVACLSVAQLILRHWPSHSRALHVKRTIEEAEPIPFAPRGIDKLEAKHVRLKFLDKRKATDENIDEGVVFKKLNHVIELHIAEASWTALADALLEILLPLSRCNSESGAEELCRSGDVRLVIHLPPGSEKVMESIERKGLTNTKIGENMFIGDCNSEKARIVKEKEASFTEEQPQERRSTRLERLRNRKPGKEEMEFATSKDLAKVVIQCLQPFIVGGSDIKDSDDATTNCSFHSPEVLANPSDSESIDVARFLTTTSKNHGAYHVAHLLLEEVACRGSSHQDAFVKFLELEKLTRHWGQDRSPECSLFLAELYYDFGFCSSDVSMLSEFMSEASYHLCKIIEFVALDYPFHLSGMSGNKNSLSTDSAQTTAQIVTGNSACHGSLLDNSLFNNKRSFWVRFFWLSGRLSSLDGNRAKAHNEFCVSLSLLTNNNNMSDPLGSVGRPYCRIVQELTTDRVLHEINLLEIDFLLLRTLGEMMEKDMYSECIDLLAPLLLSKKDVHLDLLPVANKEGEGVTSIELSALDVLIRACEKVKPMNTEVYLNCRSRRLQMLMVAAGMEEYLSSRKPFDKMSWSKTLIQSDSESREYLSRDWNYLVAEEVKAVSQCVSQVKNSIDQCADSNGFTFPIRSIGDIQSVLVTVMCNIVSIFLSKKSSSLAILDSTEKRQRCCFIDAAIAFCKLQHLNPNAPVKSQVELIVAIHDLLAEYGLCCAGGEGEGEEGTFLKFAIKHLLALDMKLKSNINSNRGSTTIQGEEQLADNIHKKKSLNESKMNAQDAKLGQTETEKTIALKNIALEGMNFKGISSYEGLEDDKSVVECGKHGGDGPDGKSCEGEKASDRLVECSNELTEDEREELELGIDNALDQCFFCLYGLNLRSDSSYEDDLAIHKNTSRGDYQTKEQCADVFQYILPCAKASSRTGLVKLRRVLRAIRKHFPQPPEDVLAGNVIDRFLDDRDLPEDKLSEAAGSDGFVESIMKIILPDAGNIKQCRRSSVESCEPYFEVYCNLYYLLAQSEEMSATDKWPGFVLTKEGEEFVEQNANLFKYDLIYNPLRFESWQRLANIYDEVFSTFSFLTYEVDLLLNDGSKHINVAGWGKNATLPQRVETSRRRSRRCLLMSLALAKTTVQQCEMHELLALVYYDSLQNVAPFYDQRSVIPTKDAAWMTACRNSMKHFKEAFAQKQDWSHAFYLGKLCEKLGCSYDLSFTYYDKAIALNPSAVDPIYRMHASRLKLLCTCGKQNVDALKIVSVYSFSKSTKEAVMNILGEVGCRSPEVLVDIEGGGTQLNPTEQNPVESHQLVEVWQMLYRDCLSALQICVEGDLKHFHRARYMLAQGLYRRGERGDLERAKDELSFCFKSSRSSFTINMWEIDGMVKKGRRKTLGLSGNKKALEVNLPESSRKFITCIRKYMLFYLKLLEETGDIYTLDRGFTSLRTDKRILFL